VGVFVVFMAQTRFIHFRVTNQQFEIIRTNAGLEGFKTVSNYLRNIALNEAPDVQKRISQIDEFSTKTYELVLKIYEGKCQMKTSPNGKELSKI
jgi:uncharacterized protein (DUF1778 family)